jgi:hypothetical protein
LVLLLFLFFLRFIPVIRHGAATSKRCDEGAIPRLVLYLVFLVLTYRATTTTSSSHIIVGLLPVLHNTVPEDLLILAL